MVQGPCDPQRSILNALFTELLRGMSSRKSVCTILNDPAYESGALRLTPGRSGLCRVGSPLRQVPGLRGVVQRARSVRPEAGRGYGAMIGVCVDCAA